MKKAELNEVPSKHLCESVRSVAIVDRPEVRRFIDHMVDCVELGCQDVLEEYCYQSDCSVATKREHPSTIALGVLGQVFGKAGRLIIIQSWDVPCEGGLAYKWVFGSEVCEIRL